jgi:hypothetical protein
MQKLVKLVIGALGGLVVAMGVVVITASAAGVNLAGLHASPSPSPVPASTPSPPARARATPNPAARAVAQAVLQAEAQALGVQPRDLTKDLRQGMSLHQVAEQKGVSQADFQARFQKDLMATLDQDVQQGTLTQQQEQQALKRLGKRGPNWDAVRAQASPSPSPSPTA